ncbi:response regulator [Azospirillum sp. SYSU D00513]|uniref:response regulator transcription factor n=1 Tax=Azospirillum sp. SYSU D00513 TaxID=2812561 RepID=UPI001A95CAD2|nr:response regulator [Azospirillum sp. SYSU D00513]
MHKADGKAVVHIVDDEPAIRNALQRLLSAAGYPCRAYASGEEFLKGSVGARDCVVADVHLPDMNGLDLLAAMNARGQSVPMLIITGFATVELAVQAMKAGAVDFLTKPFESASLTEKIETCLAVGRLRQATLERRRNASMRLSSLSEREVEVLGQVIDGKTNRAIGDILNISVKTVEAHRARIMEKTGALSLVDLTRLWDATRTSMAQADESRFASV